MTDRERDALIGHKRALWESLKPDDAIVTGGPVAPGKPYVVGEPGPEVFVSTDISISDDFQRAEGGLVPVRSESPWPVSAGTWTLSTREKVNPARQRHAAREVVRLRYREYQERVEQRTVMQFFFGDGGT